MKDAAHIGPKVHLEACLHKGPGIKLTCDNVRVMRGLLGALRASRERLCPDPCRCDRRSDRDLQADDSGHVCAGIGFHGHLLQ